MSGIGGAVPTAHLMTKQARLQGLIVGSRRRQLDFVRDLEATGLRPVIDRTFPLDAIADRLPLRGKRRALRQDLPVVTRRWPPALPRCLTQVRSEADQLPGTPGRVATLR